MPDQPPTPDPNPVSAPRLKEKMQDKRAAILDAAVALFAARGFHGTAMPDLALKANVGTGTIYRYFPTKEALVNAAYQERKGLLIAALDRAGLNTMPDRAGFLVIWADLVAIARDHAVDFRFLELHHHGDVLDETSRAISAEVRAKSLGFLEAGIAAGRIKPLPPAALMGIIWGALIGLAKEVDSGTLTLTPDLIAATGDALWDGLRV